MIKLISKSRNNPDSPIDALWSLGTLSEYPIPTDALPIVMSIWERRLMQLDADEYLTIREALWVARLYKLIELNKPKHIPPDVRDYISDYVIKNRKEPDSLPVSELAHEITVEDLVEDWASTYAGYEQLSEMEGEPFDSYELDTHICLDVYEYWGERRGNEIEGIAADYGLDRSDYYKLLTLNLPISEIEDIVKSWKYKKEVKNERAHNQEIQE
jgi:hypothetical protein